jgi:hypothetical protein
MGPWESAPAAGGWKERMPRDREPVDSEQVRRPSTGDGSWLGIDFSVMTIAPLFSLGRPATERTAPRLDQLSGGRHRKAGGGLSLDQGEPKRSHARADRGRSGGNLAAGVGVLAGGTRTQLARANRGGSGRNLAAGVDVFAGADLTAASLSLDQGQRKRSRGRADRGGSGRSRPLALVSSPPRIWLPICSASIRSSRSIPMLAPIGGGSGRDLGAAVVSSPARIWRQATPD